MNIVTKFIYPPIPIRTHDWCAYDADLEDGAPDSTQGPTGYGETEAEALKDLIPELLEHYETAAYAEGRADERKEYQERRLDYTPWGGPGSDGAKRWHELEAAMRAMNETGQGEHGVTHDQE